MPQITAAPYPIKIGDKSFHMSPLEDVDYDELSNWMRSKVVATARRCLSDDMTSEERRELIGAAVERASTMNFGDPKHMDLFMSLEGLARMYWQGVRRSHKKLEFEAFLKLFRANQDAIPEISRVFKELNYTPGERNADDGDEQEDESEVGASVEGGDIRPSGKDV